MIAEGRKCKKCSEEMRLCGNGKFLCDPCNRARATAYRMANIELVQAKDRARVAAMSPEMKQEKHKAWRDSNQEHVRQKGRETMRRLYLADPEKFRAASRDFYVANTEKCLATSNDWKEKNREHTRHYAREYAIKNLGRSRESNRIWRGNNKEEIREYVKKYRRTLYYSNPLYRLKHQMSCLIRLMIVKSGLIKVKRTHEILGCDWDFFKSHIERQFPKGMTWENRSEWHIDHITPMATASTEEEVLALNHFTNLRPMWAKDNLAKGAQITHLI